MRLEIGRIIPSGARIAVWCGLLLAAFSVACEDADDIVAPGAAGSGTGNVTLQVVSGDGQAGTVGQALAQPLVVEAVDDHGNPVPDVTIEWTPGEGSTFDSPEGTTGSDGRASADWRLGTAAGTYDAAVATAGMGTSEVSFFAEALAGAPASIEIVSGDGQTGAAGTALSEALVVRVLDEFENAIPDASLTWSPSGSSSFETPDAATGEDGLASATWRLGTSTGDYTAEVSATAGSVSFVATAMAGSAATLEIVSGDDQLSVAGSEMTDPLVVQVLDQYGNPVPGATVDWTMSHSGSASPAAVVTNATGIASTTWTLGCPALLQTATASNTSAGSVEFDGTAVPGLPALIVNLTGDLEGLLGVLLLADLDVRVEDACGNPLVGVEVDWTLTSALGGLVLPSSSFTDVHGEASTTLTLGILLGDYTVLAVAGALNTLFTVTLLP